MFLFLIGLTVLFGLVLYVYQHRRYYYLALRLPSASSIPLLGDLFIMIVNKFNVMHATGVLDRRYGKICRFWGRNLYVMVYDAKYMEILCTHPALQCKGNEFDGIREAMGDVSLFAINGESHRQSKKVFVKSFNNSSQEAIFKTFKTETETIVSRLKNETSKEWLPIIDYVGDAVAFAISKYTLDIDLNDFPEIQKHLRSIKSMQLLMVMRGISPIHRANVIFDLLGGKSFKSFVESIHRSHSEVIVERRKDFEELKAQKKDIPNQFIFNLLRELPNASIQSLTTDTITTIGGALDTSAITISFALLMLALNVEVQEKVYEEDKKIYSELHGKDIDDEILSKYEYLSRVVKETLRLYPATPIFPRLAMEEVDLGDYFVPKGASIIGAAIAIHRDPAHYKEPLKFDPDRFLPENVAQRPKYSYIPFSSGQRMCPGYRYAHQLSTYMLAALVRNFKVYTKYKSVEEIDKNLELVISLYESGNFPIRVECRK